MPINIDHSTAGTTTLAAPSSGTTTLTLPSTTGTIVGTDSNSNATITGTYVMGSSFLRNRLINGNMYVAQRLSYAATTGASGTGTTATITFSGITVPVGTRVTISGVTPTGYNGIYTVTASSAGSVSFSSTTTGSQTVAGTISFSAATVTAGTTVPTASTGYPCVDRWFVYSTGANVTAAQVVGSGSNRNLLQVTGAASVTAVGIGQRIETLNSYDLAGQTCTLSVNIANSVLTTVTWTASYANTTDTFGTIGTPTKTQIATGTFTVNSTLTQYTTNISVPSAATTGIEILFTVGAQTSGTWQIGNVQLEAGSIATPFERQIYNNQLAQCQRYYFVYAVPNVDFQDSVVRTALTLAECSVICPVTMRTNPSIILVSSPYGRLVGYSSTFSATNVNVTDIGLAANSSTSSIHFLFTNVSMTQAAAASSCSFDTLGAAGPIGLSAEL